MGPLKDSAGNLIEEDRMCDTLNNFFASVFTQENTDTVPEVDCVFNGDSSQLLCTVEITSEVAFDKIIKLKDGIKAPGDDGIIPEFLKKLASVISQPLAIIFRKSVAEGVVPQEWKRANITPLFKKGQGPIRVIIDR